MKRLFLGMGAALAMMLLPPALHAQVPVVLVCQDGTTQPGSSRVACGDHGGMDWNATRLWSEMRAGHFAQSDTVVCTDGQARAAGPRACAGHGGVDSVSTLAAVRRRAQAYRFAELGGRTAGPAAEVGRKGADTAARSTAARDTAGVRSPRTRQDSLKWGYPVDRNPEVQNPPGYRGMERPIETFPAESAGSDTSAGAAGTSRIEQLRRQDSMSAGADSMKSGPEQNPPGYRGMERPASLDSAEAAAEKADTGGQGR